MVLPLLALGVGLLGGNELLRQRRQKSREEELAEQYRGLLGAPGSAMGPPDESGGMGMTGGRGLLADPTSIARQLQFAAGVGGLPGQQAAGMSLLNAAMQRAQQEQAQQEQARQFGLNFGAGRDDAKAVQARYEQTFGAGREDAAEQKRQWEEAQRVGAHRFDITSGMDRTRLGYEGERLGLERQRTNAKTAEGIPGVNELAKLPVGYQWQPDGKGGLLAAPIAGTDDWRKGMGGLETFNSAEQRLGQMLDMIQGKETKTPRGQIVRRGGVGSAALGADASRMSTLRGQIISDVAKLRDMGVLQAGEMERIEEQLGDPTTWGSFTTFNSTLGAGYDELRKQFRTKRTDHLKSHPWLVPPPPPGATVRP